MIQWNSDKTETIEWVLLGRGKEHVLAPYFALLNSCSLQYTDVEQLKIM